MLDEARAGRGRLLLCTDEAGIGKTRLAEETAALAAARGAAVTLTICASWPEWEAAQNSCSAPLEGGRPRPRRHGVVITDRGVPVARLLGLTATATLDATTDQTAHQAALELA